MMDDVLFSRFFILVRFLSFAGRGGDSASLYPMQNFQMKMGLAG